MPRTNQIRCHTVQPAPRVCGRFLAIPRGTHLARSSLPRTKLV